MSQFQAAGWFGYVGYPPSAVPWQNRPLWDWTRCCSTANNKLFALLTALFGYTVRSLLGPHIEQNVEQLT